MRILGVGKCARSRRLGAGDVTGLKALGERIGAGELTQVTGFGLQRHWALPSDELKGLLCAGFRRTLPKEKVDQTMKHIFTKWVS